MKVNKLPRSLIIGISGQDGALIAKLLIGKGYQVWGTSRDVEAADFKNLSALKIFDKVKLLSMAPRDLNSIIAVLSDCQPDEIYFLAAQSSVGLSFEQPNETFESIAIGVLNLLEAVRILKLDARIYHASSSECFGDVGDRCANELSPFQPRSPYAIAKSSAHWLVRNYRESYGIYASNGILFNHESNLRPFRYVTRKIVSAACRIARGSNERLLLGRLDIVRDWGWAEEYVEAMWRILQHTSPDDFIIATGKSCSLMDFVDTAFRTVELDWQKYVSVDQSLFRPSDIAISRGDPSKAQDLLGWEPHCFMADVVKLMVAAEMQSGVLNYESSR
jgi:GDPmannose 4,6-dehydratase